MAARRKPFSPAKLSEMRERISATLLLKRLQDHVVGDAELSATQIKAAEILLKKCMPDLSAVEHSGEIEHKRLEEMTDAELLAIASRGRRAVSGAEVGEAESARVH